MHVVLITSRGLDLPATPLSVRRESIPVLLVMHRCDCASAPGLRGRRSAGCAGQRTGKGSFIRARTLSTLPPRPPPSRGGWPDHEQPLKCNVDSLAKTSERVECREKRGQRPLCANEAARPNGWCHAIGDLARCAPRNGLRLDEARLPSKDLTQARMARSFGFGRTRW